jgi:hypothetical protein
MLLKSDFLKMFSLKMVCELFKRYSGLPGHEYAIEETFDRNLNFVNIKKEFYPEYDLDLSLVEDRIVQAIKHLQICNLKESNMSGSELTNELQGDLSVGDIRQSEEAMLAIHVLHDLGYTAEQVSKALNDLKETCPSEQAVS